jgi:DNA-binding transcriptional MerR regulator
MFRIGEFSKLSKMTIKALRYYDEIGLVAPEKVGLVRYRYYTTDQLVKVHYIQSLRQVGLSIDEIKKILSGEDACIILEKRKTELETELKEKNDQLSRIDFILQGKEGEYFMNYQATIKEIPECIVYSKKMTIPNYDAYFTEIPAIGAECAAANPDIKCTVPGYCFVVYLDGEYREKDINVEYCEAVDKFGNEVGNIKFKKMPAITAVSIMHKGPYSNLREAYAFVFKWIEENGYTVTGSPRESYIDGIWNKKSVDEWLTEIQVPVLKK